MTQAIEAKAGQKVQWQDCTRPVSFYTMVGSKPEIFHTSHEAADRYSAPKDCKIWVSDGKLRVS